MQAAREELVARAEARGYPIFAQLEDGLKFVEAMVNSVCRTISLLLCSFLHRITFNKL